MPQIAVDRRAILSSTFYALPALLMPVFIVDHLRFGVVTPTEVSIIAVAYAHAGIGVIYRDLTWQRIKDRDDRGRHHDRRRHAGDHGIGPSRLDHDLEQHPHPVHRMGDGDVLQHEVARSFWR